ncbi:hypothetical protein [Photobacterium carnosum]|nr:hypothetical protein [Photobacterium carnosum]
MFDELPTFYTITGGLFIIAAGLLIPIIFLPIKTKPIRYYFKDN